MRDAPRRRFNYANAMATIAVFIALGGASYAALKIPRNSVGSKQLKRSSVGRKHLKQGSVGESQLGPGSVGRAALQANAVSFDELAPNAVGSDKVKDGSLAYDDLDRAAVSPRLFAHVTSAGTLVDNAGATGVTKPSTGTYLVSFDRNLNGCVATASVGYGFGAGDVYAPDASAAVSMDPQSEASQVRVETKRQYSGAPTAPFFQDNSFNLIVAC